MSLRRQSVDALPDLPAIARELHDRAADPRGSEEYQRIIETVTELWVGLEVLVAEHGVMLPSDLVEEARRELGAAVAAAALAFEPARDDEARGEEMNP